jgi:hypothetical protein
MEVSAMNRTYGRIVGAIVALMMAATLVATVAEPSQARPVPLRIDGARHKTLGGSVHNSKTHVLVSIIDTYKFYRKVKIHGKWTKHAFWGARVSTQRCKKSGCWGRIKHWNMPPRYHYGKPAGSRTSVARSGGDCPISIIGTNPLCAVPWSMVNHAVDKVTQKVVTTVVNPCAKGSLLGFGGVASANIFTKIFLEDGLITKAAAASRFEGPAGYGIATAATCTVAVANRFGSNLSGLFN